jgi:hypothetical protein
METAQDRGSIFREQHAAKSQSLFRSVNERIGPLNESFSIIKRINDFVCECADETCTETIGMSVEEYEAIREQGNRFAVAPRDAHVWFGVETIAQKHDRYWVVEKFGHCGSLSVKYDPRSREGR